MWPQTGLDAQCSYQWTLEEECSTPLCCDQRCMTAHLRVRTGTCRGRMPPSGHQDPCASSSCSLSAGQPWWEPLPIWFNPKEKLDLFWGGARTPPQVPSFTWGGLIGRLDDDKKGGVGCPHYVPWNWGARGSAGAATTIKQITNPRLNQVRLHFCSMVQR